MTPAQESFLGCTYSSGFVTSIFVCPLMSLQKLGFVLLLPKNIVKTPSQYPGGLSEISSSCLKSVPAFIPIIFYLKWKKAFVLVVWFPQLQKPLPFCLSLAPFLQCLQMLTFLPLPMAVVESQMFYPNNTKRKACFFLQVPFHQQPSQVIANACPMFYGPIT